MQRISNSEYLFSSLSETSLIYIRNPYHIKNVLGIITSLNENVFDPKFQKRIIQEQLLFETFYDSLKKWVGDKVDKVVDVIKSPADIALLLKNLIDNPKLLGVVNDTYKTKIKGFSDDFRGKLKSIGDSINKVIEQIKKIPSETVKTLGDKVNKGVEFYKNFIDGTSDYVEKVIKFLNENVTDGWFGLIKSVVLNGVLVYANEKLTKYVKLVTSFLNKAANPVDFLKSEAEGEMKAIKKEMSDDLKSHVTDVMGGIGKMVSGTFDSISDFFKKLISSYKWLWTSVVGYLSKIAKEVSSKIKPKMVGKINLQQPLDYKGRLSRDLGKIQDSIIKKYINKILLETQKKDNYNKRKSMKKVIRLNESDIERLVHKIIKEDENSVSSTDLKKQAITTGKDVGKGGLAPKERETLSTAINMLTNFFKQPGNQATGPVFNKFNMLKKELVKLSQEIKSNSSNNGEEENN